MHVHISSACVKVPRDLLKDYAIVQAEGTLSGVALPPGVTPAMVQTFSMQARDKTSPSAYEHMAVQRACHQLLSNVSMSFVVAFVLSLCTVVCIGHAKDHGRKPLHDGLLDWINRCRLFHAAAAPDCISHREAVCQHTAETELLFSWLNALATVSKSARKRLHAFMLPGLQAGHKVAVMQIADAEMCCCCCSRACQMRRGRPCQPC